METNMQNVAITFIVNGLNIDTQDKYSYLFRCIKNIYRQTVKDINCVVYMNSNEYIDKFRNDFLDVMIIPSEDEKDAIKYINLSFKTIDSKYVMILDYTDVCDPFLVEKTLDSDADIVVFGASHLGKNKRLCKVYDENELKNTENYLKSSHLFMSNLAFKTKFLTQTNLGIFGFSAEKQTFFVDYCFSFECDVQYIQSVELFVKKIKATDKFSYNFFYNFRSYIRVLLKNLSRRNMKSLKKYIIQKYSQSVLERFKTNILNKIKLKLIYFWFFKI